MTSESAEPQPGSLQGPTPRGLSFAVGDVFPDLELPAVADSSPRRISDWRGTHVMLHLFASW